MNIDTDTLARIREWRVTHDPLIPHPKKEAWLESVPENYHEYAVDARLNRLENTATDTPIQKATWVETVVFCFTRSMDSSIDHREHLGAYQHSVEQMTEELPDADISLLPESMELVTTDQDRELAESFRQYIAAAQHAVFLEHGYNDLPFDPTGVPKAFWRQELPSTTGTSETETGETHTGAQIQLTDY